MPNSIRTSKIS